MPVMIRRGTHSPRPQPFLPQGSPPHPGYTAKSRKANKWAAPPTKDVGAFLFQMNQHMRTLPRTHRARACIPCGAPWDRRSARPHSGVTPSSRRGRIGRSRTPGSRAPLFVSILRILRGTLRGRTIYARSSNQCCSSRCRTLPLCHLQTWRLPLPAVKCHVDNPHAMSTIS